MTAKRGGTGSVIGDLRQAGSLKLVFPRPVAQALEAVIVNTAGGVTGGDRFGLNATAGAGTALHLTTQAAERAYRAQPGEVGRITTRLEARAGASLHWLPQETILFQGANLERRLTVDLATDARLLLCEPLIFGRRAMGETLTDARFTDRIEVRRGGQPHVLDATRLKGDIAAHLARRDIAHGAAALACVLYIAPDAEAHLEQVRATLPHTAGTSLLHPDTLVIRVLAEDSFVLRQTLIPVLTQLSGGPLPRPWMI